MSSDVFASPRRPFPIRVVALTVLAVLLLAGFGFATRNKKAASEVKSNQPAPAPAAAAPTEVTVETVSASVLDEPVRVTGTLRTDENVVLSTKATGLVKQVFVKEGDPVRRGQLLVIVDDQDLKAQRDRTTAAVRAAQSALNEEQAKVRSAQAKLQQAKTSQGIKNAGVDADYRRAEQALSAAKTRLSQAKSLAGIASTEADNRVASAKANLQAARERLKALQEGARKQEVASAEAAVRRAQVQVNRMKSALDRREQLLREGAIAREQVDNARHDYESAQADLQTSQEQLSLVQEGPRTEEIRAQEEVVRQGEAAVRDADANMARRQISSEDVDTAETQVRQAEAAADAAKANLAQSSWNADEIRNAEAALNQAKAGVERARQSVSQAQADVRYQDELISQTRVYSPVNGVVTKRNVQIGAAVVQMRNELLTLVSLDTVYFEAAAPETSLPFLRKGLTATVLLDAAPGKRFSGVVREIIPVAEGTNRSVRLRISLPKPEGLTVVGGFARAQIDGRSGARAVSVPREALVSDQGEMGVFLLRDGKAAHRAVQVGDAGGVGDRVPVISGLSGGEQVIVDGASSLKNGQDVTVSRAAGTAHS
jgi:RND family efflux transporter MFP subunit